MSAIECVSSDTEPGEQARGALGRVYLLLLSLQEKQNGTEQEKTGGDEPPARTEDGRGAFCAPVGTDVCNDIPVS